MSGSVESFPSMPSSPSIPSITSFSIDDHLDHDIEVETDHNSNVQTLHREAVILLKSADVYEPIHFQNSDLRSSYGDLLVQLHENKINEDQLTTNQSQSESKRKNKKKSKSRCKIIFVIIFVALLVIPFLLLSIQHFNRWNETGE